MQWPIMLLSKGRAYETELKPFNKFKRPEADKTLESARRLGPEIHFDTEK